MLSLQVLSRWCVIVYFFSRLVSSRPLRQTADSCQLPTLVKYGRYSRYSTTFLVVNADNECGIMVTWILSKSAYTVHDIICRRVCCSVRGQVDIDGRCEEWEIKHATCRASRARGWDLSFTRLSRGDTGSILNAKWVRSTNFAIRSAGSKPTLSSANS